MFFSSWIYFIFLLICQNYEPHTKIIICNGIIWLSITKSAIRNYQVHAQCYFQNYLLCEIRAFLLNLVDFPMLSGARIKRNCLIMPRFLCCVYKCNPRLNLHWFHVFLWCRLWRRNNDIHWACNMLCQQIRWNLVCMLRMLCVYHWRKVLQ